MRACRKSFITARLCRRWSANRSGGSTARRLATTSRSLPDAWPLTLRTDSLTTCGTSESVRWVNGQASGDNFTLAAGSFVWVRFDDRLVLDLGLNNAATVNLFAGVNVLSYTQFPGQFSAYKLLRQLGLNNARGVRMMDAESGRWV